MKLLKIVWLASLIGVAGLATSCAENKIRNAYNEIIELYPTATSVLEIGSDDSYLTMDTNPFNLTSYYNATYITIAEQVVYKLGMPQSTWQLMLSTRALDGTRTDIKNGIFASWTYHPNNGLRATFTLAS